MTFSRMTPQGSQWEAVWPRGPVWNPDTWQKPQGKQPASTVVLGDNQESAQRCLPKTFYYSPTQNILGRNAVTNLDSILKSSDLTLLTKARLVKATVFPVVMYECESWTIKKAECLRIDAFELWCWRVESPLDCKEIKPVHPKRNRSWKFVGRTDVKAETPILWPPDAKNWLTGKDPDAGKDWRQEEKGMTEDEMVGWHYQWTWTWIWASSGSQWWTGKLGVLQSMESQRVGHDWVTELNWHRISKIKCCQLQICTGPGRLPSASPRADPCAAAAADLQHTPKGVLAGEWGSVLQEDWRNRSLDS